MCWRKVNKINALPCFDFYTELLTLYDIFPEKRPCINVYWLLILKGNQSEQSGRINCILTDQMEKHLANNF
jgi:hypothetical protein